MDYSRFIKHILSYRIDMRFTCGDHILIMADSQTQLIWRLNMSQTENQTLVLDTLNGVATQGIPIWLINPMEHRMIDRIAGVPEGTYVKNPEPTYLEMLRGASCCMVDQYLWDNPLSMGEHGYDAPKERTATTGAQQIVCDGIVIDSPEAVAEHLEKIVMPKLVKEAQSVDIEGRVRWILERERADQARIGGDMLKTPYGWIGFPVLAYYIYGYENYFMAYALYPDLMERCFALQADVWACYNRAAALAYEQGSLPPYHRLDHDMCDSRGTLVNIKSLEKIWFPHFARAIEPLTHGPVKMIWHCDGNVMPLVPGLIEAGIRGFQGFQYEDGVDYEKICAMKTRDGDDLLIVGGVSVTTTLPLGSPADAVKQLKWLVEKGPKKGLILGGSSSIAPGVPWENLKALIDGFAYYRKHGRGRH